MAISKIILNGVTQMDVTGKTVTAGSMLNGVTALKNDGTDVTGSIQDMTLPSAASATSSGTSKATITPGSSAQYLNIPAGYLDTAQYYTIAAGGGGGVDIPVFTVTFDDNYESIVSVTCNKTYPECNTIQNGGNSGALVTVTNQSHTEETTASVVLTEVGSYLRYTWYGSNGAIDDIRYDSNGTITYVQPSSMAEAFNITSNGTYYPNGKTISEVNVTVPSSSPTLQAKTNISPTTSSQTITADSEYDGLSSVQINAMPLGSAGTPTATKGSVSNHSVSVTPSVTNTTGYITGSTKTGTAVTVSASELVSGSETKTANGTYDVTNLAQLVVNVPSSGSSKNVQVAAGVNRVSTTTYTAVSGQSITVAKTGTYDVYWTGFRSSTSGASGSQLYIDNASYGSEQNTFSNHGQSIHLSNVSLTQDQVVTIYAKSRSTSFYMYVGNLTIVEQ